MNDEDIRQLWGSRLRPITAKSLPDGRVSAETRRFLTEVGLPDEAPLLVSFAPDLLAPLEVDGIEYLTVGDDYGTQLGIEANAESVWSVDPEGSLPKRLVNSSLRAFIASLGTYVQWQPDLRDASDDEAAGIVDQLRHRILEIDALAFNDPENWWSVILEQTADGLL
jgi:hypothetical protein